MADLQVRHDTPPRKVEFYKLCSSCSAALKRAHVTRNMNFNPRYDIARKKYPPQNYTIHESLEAFHAALQAGCHFCAIIQNMLAEWQALGTRVTKISLTKEFGHNQVPQFTIAWVEVPICNPNLTGEDDLGPEPSEEIYSRPLHFERIPNRARVPQLPEPVGNTASHWDSTASREHMELARRWLDCCFRDHPKCHLPDPDFVPTRLLEISDDATQVRLRIMKAHGLRITKPRGNGTQHEFLYCALSHCWGGVSDILTLTSATLSMLQAGIPTSRLAKTFQDAALIAVSALGIKYLWIDSLCIVQDSRDDWVRESALMAPVYENSACTIAAAAASNSHQGCFSSRNLLRVTPCLIAGSLDDGIVAFHDREFYGGDDSSPLSKRAWVLQEQTLSPRTLDFGSETGMCWACLSCGADEIGTSNALPGFGSLYNQEFDRMREMVANCDWSAESKLVGLHVDWFHIVGEYTQRLLTKGSDKLIAFSALAHRAKTITQFHYLAGLWEETLIYNLHWCLESNRHRRPRPTSYRAPTWSWASIDGYVDESFSLGGRDNVPIATIVSADTETHEDDSNGTGIVTGGSLVISGHLMELPFANLAFNRKKRMDKPWPSVYCNRDIELDDAGQPEVVYLLALSMEPVDELDLDEPACEGYELLQGMVLQRLSDKAGYERVGWFYCEPKSGSEAEDLWRWQSLGISTVTIF
ncbi:heterokaryon incompatibility protein-domain-containing protein [Cladorrhinum sp. PSN259]|nr:heterokaryon incompatibility protein-domain-containing protein [Cladorrhinum sp. PSN259]